jgi:hypothetical protein
MSSTQRVHDGAQALGSKISSQSIIALAHVLLQGRCQLRIVVEGVVGKGLGVAAPLRLPGIRLLPQLVVPVEPAQTSRFCLPWQNAA